MQAFGKKNKTCKIDNDEEETAFSYMMLIQVTDIKVTEGTVNLFSLDIIQNDHLHQTRRVQLCS
jgi:hypothetical protein